MNKLDQLLSITDSKKREKALLSYAKSLGVDLACARDQQNGSYIEEKLAVLIFDAQQNPPHPPSKQFKFASLSASGGIILFIIIFVIAGFIVGQYRIKKEAEKKKEKLLEVYDEKTGEILYKADGVYRQYDEKGNVKYEYIFEKGKMISKKEFDAKGRVITEHTIY